MLRTADRILTAHAGSLPRTPALLEANRAKGGVPEAEFDQLLQDFVVDVVRRQDELRPRGHPGGAGPLPPVPGLLARPAHHGPRLRAPGGAHALHPGGRSHPQIAVAKLGTLARGAELTSRRLRS